MPVDLDVKLLDSFVDLFVQKKGLFLVIRLAKEMNLIHADIHDECSLRVEKEGCICRKFGIGVKEIHICRFGGLSGEYEMIDHPPYL